MDLRLERISHFISSFQAVLKKSRKKLFAFALFHLICSSVVIPQEQFVYE